MLNLRRKDKVYIVWNKLDKEMRNIILLSKSDDAGKTFAELRERSA